MKKNSQLVTTFIISCLLLFVSVADLDASSSGKSPKKIKFFFQLADLASPSIGSYSYPLFSDKQLTNQIGEAIWTQSFFRRDAEGHEVVIETGNIILFEGVVSFYGASSNISNNNIFPAGVYKFPIFACQGKYLGKTGIIKISINEQTGLRSAVVTFND